MRALKRALQFGVAALKEELRVADGLLVYFGGSQSFNAGAQAAVDVVLQARTRVVA